MNSAAAIPSSSALCASMGPKVTSPMHLMLDVDVVNWESMMMRPLGSRETPAAARLRPST